MLSTAELLLGLTRHLRTYAMGPERAELGQLEFAGNVLEIAVRLRGSGTTTGERTVAIATDAGIDRRRLVKDVLPTLQSLNLVETLLDASGRPLHITERLPPLNELLQLADALLKVAGPEPVELALLKILDATTIMPLTEAGCIDAATQVAAESDAVRAVRYLEALHLCARQRSDDGAVVLYNPNIWASDVGYANAALQAESGPVRQALAGLIEEVAGTAGLPEAEVTSADKKWINFAVSQGLLLRSVVQTTSGDQRSFLFAPHMGRNAFSGPTGADPTGHVRQVIGSMMFAHHYAANRLWSPTRFLEALVRNGEAGDSSYIGTDYPMLEKAGIVRVEPAARYSKFVLLQADIAEDAITYLNTRGGENSHPAVLRDQVLYRQPEGERARIRLARASETSPAENARLIAALRQEVGQRRYGR